MVEAVPPDAACQMPSDQLMLGSVTALCARLATERCLMRYPVMTAPPLSSDESQVTAICRSPCALTSKR